MRGSTLRVPFPRCRRWSKPRLRSRRGQPRARSRASPRPSRRWRMSKRAPTSGSTRRWRTLRTPPSVAPSDRTAAILAASNGNWIEAIEPFVPSDGPNASDAASASEQMRRRRRRGGRRGGRGRRPGPGPGEHREDSLSPVPDTQAAGSVTEAGAPPQAHDASSGEGPRPPARRRRRRGGSGRRRTTLDGRSATEGADRTVTASAEPPADS